MYKTEQKNIVLTRVCSAPKNRGKRKPDDFLASTRWVKSLFLRQTKTAILSDGGILFLWQKGFEAERQVTRIFIEICGDSQYNQFEYINLTKDY